MAFRNYFTEKTKLEADIRNLNKSISEAKAIKDICPTCGQKLLGVVKPDTTDKEKEVEELNKKLNDINVKLNECNTKHAEYQAAIKTKYEATILDLKKQISEAKANKETLQREINSLNITQNKLTETLTKLNFDKDN